MQARGRLRRLHPQGPADDGAHLQFMVVGSNQLDAFFEDYSLERLSGNGHFTPLEATDRFAEAIKQRLAS